MVVEGFADHFSSVAPAYASWRPHYPDSLFAWLGGLPARRELAWDCGAGSGQATLALTPFFRRVVATDASAAQLAAAPTHPRVEYRVTPAEASGLEAGSVDLVTVAQALHWFTLTAFYDEVDRVLAPGGVLAVWTYASPRLRDTGLQRCLERFYTDIVGPYWPPERRHVEDGYRTLPFPFVELPVPEFKMTASWTLEQLLGFVGTWSATARFRELQGRDPVVQLRAELAAHWGPAGAEDLIEWPLSLRVGSPRRS
jgi:SAM-dependent methyltransferase